MEWFLLVIIFALVLALIAQKVTPRGKGGGGERPSDPPRRESFEDIEIVASMPEPETVVEFINDDGVPEFKYRFQAILSFSSPASALMKHGVERFIPRANGNRDAIEEPGGYWITVSPWDSSDFRERYEEEPFKYIGGSKAYIDLLLAVRKVYESSSFTPQEKKEKIKQICEENKPVYTVRHVHVPPWEELLVPVFSLADGLGPHRISLLNDGGMRTIADVRKQTDAEILEIKGIGKAALSIVRNLSSQWAYDADTEVIERDVEYRKSLSLGHDLA